MSALRPLPAQPNLEFERKEAKALLRRLRAGDAAALERARALAAYVPRFYGKSVDDVFDTAITRTLVRRIRCSVCCEPAGCRSGSSHRGVAWMWSDSVPT
jgi:hypothetical protein